MEIIKQINLICVETDNRWFLMHNFTKVALCDLQLNEKLEKENIFNEEECICAITPGANCMRCFIEMERDEELNKLNLNKSCNNIYQYDTCCYTKSIWIIPEKIDDEIPGFILIKCSNHFDGFTHELVFACVRPKYRKKGILKNMVNRIPKEWNIWLEADSTDIKNVENIWEKCGFSYLKGGGRKRLIYKKMAL